MKKRQGPSSAHLMVRENQGLIGVAAIAGGQQATEFFADDNDIDETAANAETQMALGSIGAWADLDWDSAVEELDQLRHGSTPTLPLDL